MDRRLGGAGKVLVLSTLAGLLAPPLPLQAAQSLFWLQTDASTSRLGTAQNPQVTLQAGRSLPLYLWLDADGLSYGFDGISFDVRLLSSDGGSANVSLVFDEPPGRWHATTGGGVRNDSGGAGVEDCNAVDLSNTTTLTAEPVRLATLQVTGVTAGTVRVFLCVGAMGIADGGENVVVWLGLGNGTTGPETQLINGGVPGLCSSIPEATITVTTAAMGDFDGDNDVDQEDYGHLQECLSGTTMQTRPECADTLLNGDPFVDESDVQLFLQCFSGPNVLPPAACR